MIIVNGTVRFAAGKLDGLREALGRNVKETRGEPGCLAYVYGVDVDDPDVVHVSEQWESDAAIDAHMASPHMAELMTALEGAIESIAIKAYEAHYARTLLG